MKCWSLSLYYKRSDWKSWLSERFSETLISKLRNKKNTCRRSLQKWSNIELYSSPMVLLKIFDRSIYGIATWNSQEKIKVGNTTWGKVARLDWSKMPKQFSLNSRKILSVSGNQVSKYLVSSFPFSDFYILSSLLGCYFSGISCAFHFGKMFNGFLTSTFDFYWSLAIQFLCIRDFLKAGFFLQ